MAQERVVGFVVGSDTVQDRTVWKVKDKEGKKYEVASVHDNIALAPGLDVSFYVGSFKEGEQVVRKAVDVRPLSDTREELRIKVKPSDYDSLSLVVVADENDGSQRVWITNHKTEQEAREWAKSYGRFVDFKHFNIHDFAEAIMDFEVAEAGFHAISAISYIDGVDRAIEELLTVAFHLGQAQRGK